MLNLKKKNVLMDVELEKKNEKNKKSYAFLKSNTFLLFNNGEMAEWLKALVC